MTAASEGEWRIPTNPMLPKRGVSNRVVTPKGIRTHLGTLITAEPSQDDLTLLHKLRASRDTVHLGYYDARLEPVLKVRSGDSVEVETVSGRGGFLNREEERLMHEEIPQLKEIEETKDRGQGSHTLTGPIEIFGSRPGDVLAVTVEKIRPSISFGFNIIVPNRGALPEDYPYTRARLIMFDRKRKHAMFSPGVKVPLAPFFGHHGVAPPALLGRVSSQVPGPHGGNLDNKELGAGSVVYLPVHVDGALYSVGDGHAVQGDGEVNLTALETSMHARVSLRLKHGMNLKWPMGETKAHVICMGYHQDLDEAAKIAVRNMISYLNEDKGMNRDDAYVLCSIAVDLHVTQLVNDLKGVHALLPKGIFRRSLPRRLRRY